MKVRIVEDDESIRELLEMTLHRGHDIDVVTTGSDFESLLSEEPWEGIEAAIIDINLDSPVTGADVLGYLKENYPGIRRVALTAIEFPADGLENLADAILIKPASTREIEKALHG